MAIIVTQHQELVEYLQEQGFKAEKVIPYATPEDVRGKDVMGELPFSLAAEARTVTVVILDPPPDRGEDLSKEEVARRSQGLETYVVLSDLRVDQVRDEMLAYAAQQAPLVNEDEVTAITFRTLYKESWRNPIAVAAHPDLAVLVEKYSGKEPLSGPLEGHHVEGRTVYGSLPLHLAERATFVSVPEFNLTPEERKQRLSPEELQSRVEWKDYTVYTESDYLYRTRLVRDQINTLQQIKEAGLYHDQTERILEQARKMALDNRAEIYFYRGEGQVVVTPDPLSDPYLRLPADRRLYLIEDIESKGSLFQTLAQENGEWKLRPSREEATWALVIRSLEELDRLTEGRFQHPRGWAVPDQPHYTLESRPGVVFVQEGDSWKALPDYKLFAKDAEPAPKELEWLKHVDKSPEFDRPTFRQWTAAYNLAEAHEHEWASLSRRELHDALAASRSNREMEARVLDARLEMCGPFGGIFPVGTVEKDRYVLSHSTETGRLTWEVDQRGNLHLEVRRPSHHPLQGPRDHSGEGYAVLVAEYDSSTRQWKMREVGNDDALPRHVHTLCYAANATDRTLPAELREELRARARENEAAQAERNLEVSEPMQRALGEDLVEALRNAYYDTPAIAERLRERSRGFSLER